MSEVYNVPRVAEIARELGMTQGFFLDLSRPTESGYVWNFWKRECRERALRPVRALKPFMLIGSPECRIWCPLQHLGANTPVFYGVLERSRLQAQLIRHSKTNRLVENPWRAHRGHTHPNKNANSLIGRVPREVLQVGPLGPLWLFVAVPCTCWSKTNIWPSWPALGPGPVQRNDLVVR